MANVSDGFVVQFYDKDAGLVQLTRDATGNISYCVKGELRVRRAQLAALPDGCLQILDLDEPEAGGQKVRPALDGIDAPTVVAQLFARSGLARHGACLAHTARVVEEDLPELLLCVLRTPNPQVMLGSTDIGEAQLISFVCGWLEARGIPFEADASWGVHAVLSSSPAAASKPGVLLAAHMDSDHLDLAALHSLRLDRDADVIRHEGEVGLDDKTGVAMALFVLEMLRTGTEVSGLRPTADWSVHVLFTVGEESGQKGAIRAPIGRLLAGRVQYGIVIDRMTRGSNAPRGPEGEFLRHVVTTYKGVPLLDRGCGGQLLTLLRRAHQTVSPGAPALQGIESPNCADALEFRGRWDAEIVAPQLLELHPRDQELAKAVEDYRNKTATVRGAMDAIAADQRVSSMNAKPRSSRYRAMAKVHELLEGRDVPADMHFSCVNLSYDYDEDWGAVNLAEIRETVNLIFLVVAQHFD